MWNYANVLQNVNLTSGTVVSAAHTLPPTRTQTQFPTHMLAPSEANIKQMRRMNVFTSVRRFSVKKKYFRIVGNSDMRQLTWTPVCAHEIHRFCCVSDCSAAIEAEWVSTAILIHDFFI